MLKRENIYVKEIFNKSSLKGYQVVFFVTPNDKITSPVFKNKQDTTQWIYEKASQLSYSLNLHNITYHKVRSKKKIIYKIKNV